MIVLAIRSPYDRRVISDDVAFLTTYDDSPAMLASACDVLVGRREPPGVLPVRTT